MTFVIRSPVRKARFVTRPSAEPEWKAIHQTADRFVGPIGREIRDAAEILARSVDTTELRPSLERKDAGAAIALMAFPEFEKRLTDKLTPLLLATLQAGARTSAPFLQQQGHIRVIKQDATLQFDAANPRAIREASRQAANLVRQVSLETKLAIREVIVRAQAEGLSIAQQMREIRQLVGLTSRQAQAVRRAVQTLAAGGLSGDVLRRRAEQLFRTALRRRATNIARTETLRAAHLGQQELWRQAADQGFLNTNEVRRVWITTPDDRLCPFCEPMDGTVVGFEESFRSGVVQLARGGLRSLGNTLVPPLHPSCRCSIGLEVT